MMSPKTKAKRMELITLSKGAQMLVKMGVYATVNDCLVSGYKEDTGATEFNTFKQWKDKGFSIKKGSTAFLVWSSPKTIKIETDTEDEKDYQYFAMCYLFSNKQVEK